jgi:hypothetical protein
MAQADSSHAEHPVRMPDEHGNSPAAWTGVGIIGLGAVVAAVGLVITNLVMFLIAAIGSLIVGGLVWKLMADAATKHGGRTAPPTVPPPPSED